MNPVVIFLLSTIFVVGLTHYNRNRIAYVNNGTEQVIPSKQPRHYTNDWKTYTDSISGYSIMIPKDWYDLGSQSNQKYFANENIGAPLEGSNNLIWLTISKVYFNSLKAEDENSLNGYKRALSQRKGETVDMDGLKITVFPNIFAQGHNILKYSMEPAVDTEYYHATEYLITKGDTFINVSFATLQRDVGDRNIDFFDTIATSVLFIN
ncbi:MAG TPA: hypothetical protein VGK27_05625 [Candidatus Deferrimicrobiaceae bacterium]